MGMKILYKNKAAERQFSSEYKRNWKYPEQVKKKLEAAENYIRNASSLLDIKNFPPFRVHKLSGDRKGEWSISLGNTGYRVTFIPCDDNGNELLGGDIIARCKTIKVICITEVSNHYE